MIKQRTPVTHIPKEKKPTLQSMRAAKKKELLLKTAHELFSEYGYANVTVEDITTRAGVSKGSFYSYFSAKEALLAEHFRQVNELYEETYRSFPEGMTVIEKLLRLVDVMCVFCEETCGIDFMKVIFANQLLHSAEDVVVLRVSSGNINSILLRLAEEGKRTMELPSSFEDEVWARQVAHLIHGMVFDWCMENGAFNLREEAARAVRQIGEMSTVFTRTQ